jgi:hypothetical protein
MNPEALQTTAGIVYVGRSSAQYDLQNSIRTWDEFGMEFIQFVVPCLCSVGKLALRGVQVSSYPLDMSELSDFRGLAAYSHYSAGTGGRYTWNGALSEMRPAGFAPVVVYNPNQVALQYLVTIEWRVRFDPSNPAAGSHTYHGTAPDSLWDEVTSTAAAMGHGVEDIAEVVAAGGAIVGGIAALG